MRYIDKRTIHRFLKWLQVVKTWQLVIILLLSLFFSASLLRLNSLQMSELRNKVVEADKAGDKEAIRGALVRLQNYVAHHMNTSLGSGIYLTEQYARDREAAINSNSQNTNPNAAVYQQASIECREKWQGNVASFRNDYVTCVQARVKALGVADDPSGSSLPQPEDYRYNFASPAWSFDAAGLSVAFCIFVTSVIVIRAITSVVLRMLLKHRFKML